MSKYLLIISSLLLLFSCKKYEAINTIGETEYYFDEKLSSISLDDYGDFWVGSETGDIFNFKGNLRISYDLGEDRIYKIDTEVTNTGDSLFWIGVRNSGLQKWIKNKNNRLEKLKTYAINVKQDRYSPYDFITVDNIIYVATSQGVYSLDKSSDADTLTAIYPLRASGNSYITHNICQYKSKVLFASTPNGVLSLDLHNHKMNFILEGHYIEYVSTYNDTLFTVSDNHLYLHTLNGDLIDKIKTGNGLKLYYQAHGVHFLVGTKELLLSNNLKEFLNIRLRRTVPMKCRNVILPDTINNFTYLLTENAIWKIPNNIDAFKGNKSIKASFSNAENIYYLSMQNELYVQNTNSNDAEWIYTFPDDNLVQWIDISGDELFFYNAENEFQKMKISHNWIENTLFNSTQILVQPKEKITSANIKNVNDKVFSYLGIQDGMIIIDGSNKIDTISELSDVYVTAMFSHKNTDRLYVSTLNDGVFYLDQSHQIKKVEKTQNTFFIEDIITTNNHISNLITLTNQHIISQNPTDSLRIKGYKKLLYVNDTLFYALPEFGIQKFIISNNEIVDKGVFYKDIRFSESSSYYAGGKLALVSNVGALSFIPNKELDPIWIQFDSAIDVDILTSLLLILLALFLVLFITIFLFKRRNDGIVQIINRKKDLAKRVDDLMIYYNGLDETLNAEISDLKECISLVDIQKNNKQKANLELEDLSIQTAQLNRDIALHIPKKLDEQILEIEKLDLLEKTQLVELSKQAKMHGDIEVIKNRIKLNEIWLQQSHELIDDLDKNIGALVGCVEINGVNSGLLNRLESIRGDKLSILTDLLISYKIVSQEVLNIETIHSSDMIAQYVDQIGLYIKDKVEKDKKLSFMSDAFDDIKIVQNLNDNFAVLKKIKPLNDQLQILQILDDIRSCVNEYKEIHDRITKENKNQINKKFDQELASIIGERTQNITRKTTALISSLYSHLQQTDSSVLGILRLTNTEGQHAKVLALLIADLKIKRALIPGILGIYGNLNPVVSRLINDRIKANEELLRRYQKLHNGKSVFAYLVFNLLD